MRLSSCETVPKFSQEQSMSKPPEQPDPPQGGTLQQPDLPEEEIPTRRTPRVVMPTQHPSAQENTDGGIANPSAAEIDETPTQRIRRIKTATQQPSTHEKPGERPADSADADTDETPTQRIRRIKTPTQQPSTHEKPGERPADSADADTDETPTQRVRRIKTPTQQPSTQEKTDERAADTANVDLAAADPDESDSLEEPPVRTVVVAAADPFPRRQRQELDPAPRRNPAGKKRSLSAGLAVLALSALLAGALFFSGRDGGKVTAQPVATGTGS